MPRTRRERRHCFRKKLTRAAAWASYSRAGREGRDTNFTDFHGCDSLPWAVKQIRRLKRTCLPDDFDARKRIQNADADWPIGVKTQPLLVPEIGPRAGGGRSIADGADIVSRRINVDGAAGTPGAVPRHRPGGAEPKGIGVHKDPYARAKRSCKNNYGVARQTSDIMR